MSNSSLSVLNQLTVGEPGLEFLVVEEELVDQNKESIWFISLEIEEEVRKFYFH